MPRPRVDGPTLRAVRRAEDFYTPPPRLPPDAWNLVPPAERVIAYLEQVEQRRYPRPEGNLPGAALIARVDAGRWVAQCPDCLSAQVVTPTDPRFWCVDCQPDGWATVRFPADPAAVETQVASQPARRRFWWAPDDTAWNRPRRRPPLTAKQQQAIDDVDNPPTPSEESPPGERGRARASVNAPHVGRG